MMGRTSCIFQIVNRIRRLQLENIRYFDKEMASLSE